MSDRPKIFLTQKWRIKGEEKTLLKRVDKAEKKWLNYAGAIIRKSARRNIRRRKRVSRPGESPTNQTGRLRNDIVYNVNPDRGYVVIGPQRAGNTKNVLQSLEYGGVSYSYRSISIYSEATNGERTVKRVRKRIVRNIAARPFMGPAFNATQQSIDRFWADAIRKA